VLLRDRALMWFTLSGLLASFVGGSFASCISQYVLVVADSDFAEKVVAVVLPVNAAVVVALQYAVGRRLSARNIRPLMTFGTFCFVLGLGDLLFPTAACCYGGSLPPCLRLARSFTRPVSIC
jgi:drug/metabolite transporter (DMT)-like permease